ncbi:DUF116 domain-containing protein [Dehalobacterium formicoaceticum]|uniref:DUF116 domain-containing protein n=1 Tax=Dehalobacterium formicoaceticum TaxID=51515 RepID=A0ABT1Y1A4_9FIRM|nr:DUF116 domain-containing protein [Dehalobacterium formicoaceticum]MCR6544639.1 DUF116 domain-containing protein [Dehalobacterium formicoaceticum]
MKVQTIKDQPQVRKRLFIGLLLISLCLMVGSVVLIWFLAIHRELMFYRVLLVLFAALLLSVILLIGLGIIGMVLTIYQSRAFPSMEGMMRIAINLMFPVALGVGHVFGLNKEQIKRSFIEVNNQMVYSHQFHLQPQQIMILAPHCLQRNTCPYKITMDVRNCQRCGACVVNDLLDLTDYYGVSLVVATGGTLARKFIEKYRPQGIVAIACERDLTSGIIDVNPLPVLGILNIRPEGPCLNTTVSLEQVEDGIRYFLPADAKEVHKFGKVKIAEEV